MKKKYIFVTGMHRSGTSLVANLLKNASVYMGDSSNLLPPNFDNRFGFFEHKDFLFINDKILGKVNSKWDTIEKIEIKQKHDLSEEKLLAEKFLNEISKNHRNIALKDPRATLTLPFWSKRLENNKIKIIFVIRNPLEIQKSLEKRNSFSKEKSLKIWEIYTKQGIENADKYDTLFVKYEEILRNPFPNFKRMLNFLNIDYEEETLKNMYFALAPEVRHSVFDKSDFLYDKNIIPSWRKLFKKLEKSYKTQLKEFPLEKVDIKITVDDVNRHLKEKNSRLGNQLDICRKEKSRLDTQILDLETKIHKYTLSEKNKLNQEMINSFEEEIRSLENEIQIIERERDQLIPDATITRDLKGKSFWKLVGLFVPLKISLQKLIRYFKNFFINIKRDGLKMTFTRIGERIFGFIERKKQKRIDQNRYKYWLKNNQITRKQRKKIKSELDELNYLPLMSIIMPVYNVKVKWLKKAIKSIENQIYTNWELCIADDASTNYKLIKYLEKLEKHPKIKITFRKENGHISEASNSALKLAEGDFVALMDNDDILQPHALAEVVKLLNRKKDTDLIYSDEDKITVKDKRVEPFFKPDWSPDLFMSSNYLCHLTVIRKELVKEVGGFRKGFEGSQDYDLFLRVTEKTDNIEHIPDILYSWRKIPGSTASEYGEKNYADKASIKALGDSLKRRNINATVKRGLFPGSFRIKYKLEDEPLVSIIIPTKDKYEYIERCISSLLQKTTYNNYEILIVDTGSIENKTLRFYDSLKANSTIKILHWNKRFNYSSVNNFGVKHARGEYVLLLNNDTEIITPNWIEGMLEHAQREEIGAVGVKLYYPNDLIQHAGVVLGINGGSGKGVAGHAFKGLPKEVKGFPIQKDIIRNYSAVTAACLMIKKEKFFEVEGLDDIFRIAFNDVDFCLKLIEKGYYNIYTPYVELYHHESVSVGVPEKKTRDVEEFGKEIDLMYKRWGTLLLEDPFYNKNLTLKEENFNYKI
jgi:glycosyltransferase involved in cell wall biosynthesis